MTIGRREIFLRPSTQSKRSGPLKRRPLQWRLQWKEREFNCRKVCKSQNWLMCMFCWKQNMMTSIRHTTTVVWSVPRQSSAGLHRLVPHTCIYFECGVLMIYARWMYPFVVCYYTVYNFIHCSFQLCFVKRGGTFIQVPYSSNVGGRALVTDTWNLRKKLQNSLRCSALDAWSDFKFRSNDL